MADRVCPVCRAAVPPNEWAAYGRHEDCRVPRRSVESGLDLTPVHPIRFSYFNRCPRQRVKYSQMKSKDGGDL